MLLRLRSVLPLSLSGVLAFIGLWWYTSRKKRRLTANDTAEDKTTDRLSSPKEGGSGVVQNGHSTETDRHRKQEKEGSFMKQEVVASTNTQAAERGAVPLDQSQPKESVGRVGEAEECLTPGKSFTESTESLSGESAGITPQPSPPSQTPDTTNSTLTKGCVEGVRPDPEGEVGEEKMRVRFAETRPRISKEILPVLSAMEDTACGPSPPDATCPRSTLTALSTSPLQAEEPEPSRISTISDDMNQLAAGFITDVVSAAVSVVLKERASENASLEQDASPLCNSGSGDPCTTPGKNTVLDSTAQSEVPRPSQEDQRLTTASENSSSSPVVRDEGIMPRSSSRTETEQTGSCPDSEPEDDEEEEEDDNDSGSSSSSSCQSEEGSSGEDYRRLSPTVPEIRGDSVDQVGSPRPSQGQAEAPSSPNPGALSNGHRTVEVECVQGSGVPSMDSVDGYCEQGAGDNQLNSSQASVLTSSSPSESPPVGQPQSSSQNSSQPTGPQTTWEIEVPKHLVGRLIGKQGRYVSFLKETSGAKVFITTLPFTQEVQICHIEGTKEQVDCALELIRKKFKDLELTNCHTLPATSGVPSLPITSWLLLPPRVTVEVTVVHVASGNYVFLQQHTHPTFHALRSLDQQMRLCYSHPGCPTLPAPVEVGVICAAQMPEGGWWRAQVMRYSEESREVEVRYVDYGGYDTVVIDTLRQIRSDFVSLPFQASEVIVENIAPLPGDEDFSAAAKSALEDLTQGVPLLAQVTDFHTSGIPLVQIWRTEGEELVSVNHALVEKGLCWWTDSP